MDPFEVLGLDQSASPDDIKARWKVLRSELHPDRPTGNADKFHEATVAFAEAMVIAREPRRCKNCDGAKTVTVSRGFNSIKLPCQECGGTGVEV